MADGRAEALDEVRSPLGQHELEPGVALGEALDLHGVRARHPVLEHDP